MLDRLAHLQESLRLPVISARLRDDNDIMESAKASVLAKEPRLANYLLRSQRIGEPPATWGRQAELMDHDSEQELLIEQAGRFSGSGRRRPAWSCARRWVEGDF